MIRICAEDNVHITGLGILVIAEECLIVKAFLASHVFITNPKHSTLILTMKKINSSQNQHNHRVKCV